MRAIILAVASLMGSLAFQLSLVLFPAKLQPYAWLVKWLWAVCILAWLFWLLSHPFLRAMIYLMGDEPRPSIPRWGLPGITPGPTHTVNPTFQQTGSVQTTHSEAKIEQHFHIPERPTIVDSAGGFIQFERMNLMVDSLQVGIGQAVKVQYYFANRGVRPVHDVQSWGFSAVLDPQKNPGTRLRPLMLESFKTGYETFKGCGNTVGVGIENFNYAPGEPFTAEQVEDLKHGTVALHFMAGGAWRDDSGKASFWVECKHAVIGPSLDMSRLNWRTS